MKKSFFGLLILLTILVISSCNQPKKNDIVPASSLDTLLNQGIDEIKNLEYQQAFKSLSKLRSITQNQKNAKFSIAANLNLGILYSEISNDEEALNYFSECLRVSEKEGFPYYLSSIYANIGELHAENNAYNESLKYFTKALAWDSTNQDSIGMATNLVSIGLTCKKLKREEYARKNLLKAKPLLEGAIRPDIQFQLHHNIAEIDLSEGELKNALANYKYAYQYAISAGEPLFSSQSDLGLAEVYFQLSRLDSAHFHAQRAIEHHSDTQIHNYKIAAYELLGAIALANHAYDSAKANYDRAVTLQDALINEREIKTANDSRINYAIGKQNSQIESQLAKSTDYGPILLAGLIVAMAISLLVMAIMRSNFRNRKQRDIISEQNRRMASLEKEKEKAVKDISQIADIRASQISELEKQNETGDLTQKNKELIRQAMHLVNKNETFTSIQTSVTQLKNGDAQEQTRLISELDSILHSINGAEDDWGNFKIQFEEVHPDFFNTLSNHNPDLNKNDYRICAYFKLGLTSKEIAQILHITPNSVRKRKQRLKEKLNFESSQALLSWLQ